MLGGLAFRGDVCLRCLFRALKQDRHALRRRLHTTPSLSHNVKTARGNSNPDYAAAQDRDRYRIRQGGSAVETHSIKNAAQMRRKALEKRIGASASTSQTAEPPAPSSIHRSQDEDSVNVARSPDHVPLRPKAWRAFLRSKSLGEPTSVLVVRDAEGQQRRWEMQEDMETQPAQDISIKDLIESMNAAKTAPDQREVNEAIDGLKPRQSKRDAEGPIVLSQKSFTDLLSSLDEKFNQLQLSRYVTIGAAMKAIEQNKDDTQETERGKTKKRREKSVKASPSGTQTLRPWTPMGNDGVPLPLSQQRTLYKGKKAVIDNLLRKVWNIEVVEETHGPGVLALGVEQDRLVLLMEDRSPQSVLAKVSKQYNITVNVDSSSSALMIVSDKPTCVAAANNITKSLAKYHYQKLPLQTLMDPGSWRFDGRLQIEVAYRIASEHGCKLTEDATKHGARQTPKGKSVRSKDQDRLWTLHSFSQDRATACIREIVAAADGRYGTSRFLINTEAPEEDGTGPAILLSTPSKSQKLGAFARHARYITPARVARGDTPTMLRVDYNLLTQDNLSRALRWLEQGFDPHSVSDPEEHVGRSTYTATIGQVKWDAKTLPPSLRVENEAMGVLQGRERHTKFDTTLLGLSGLLHRLPDLVDIPPISSVSELRATLINHPLSLQTNCADHYPPILEVSFQAHPRERLLKHKDMTLILPAPVVNSANLLCPGLATDVYFSHARSLSFRFEPSRVNKRMGREMVDYIRAIESSSAGYGRVSAPPDARLWVPMWRKQEGLDKSSDHPTRYAGMKMMDRKMFTSSVRFVQEIRWALPQLTGKEVEEDGIGPQLVYKSISGGEDQPSHQKLEVQYVAPFNQTKLFADKRQAFLDAINGVLAGLNRGLGKMDMKPFDSPIEGEDGDETQPAPVDQSTREASKAAAADFLANNGPLDIDESHLSERHM